jgi:hypothetical protein
MSAVAKGLLIAGVVWAAGAVAGQPSDQVVGAADASHFVKTQGWPAWGSPTRRYLPYPSHVAVCFLSPAFPKFARTIFLPAPTAVQYVTQYNQFYRMGACEEKPPSPS